MLGSTVAVTGKSTEDGVTSFSLYDNKIKMIVEARLPHRRDFVDQKKKSNTFKTVQ